MTEHISENLRTIAQQFERACNDEGIEAAKLLFESSTWAIGGQSEVRLTYYDGKRKIHIWKEGEEWV